MAGDAASAWERWRDEIRQLHEVARARKAAGSATPRTRALLERHIANAPQGTPTPGDLEGLSEEDALDWLGTFREAGIAPRPTERQWSYLKTLVEELELTAQEAGERVGLKDLDEIRTSAQASALIDELSRLRDERRPPSRKQKALIERLREEAGLSEKAAAALVDEPDLDGLTGGREGSASALIDRLLEETGKETKGDDG